MSKGNLNIIIPKEIPAKEARVKFGEIIDRARYGHTQYLVKKGAKPMAVILGVEDYEDILDTIDTLREETSPEFQASLERSYQEYEKGEVGTLEDIKRILKV